MSRSILLIDDDPDVLAVLGCYFESRGWEVSRAPDGQAAIELYEAARPDVVISDLGAPGPSGQQVLEVLRQRDPSVILLILTDHGRVATAVEAMRELRNVLERAQLMAAHEEAIAPEHLPPELRQPPGALPEPESEDLSLHAVERRHIAGVLERFGSNRAHCARLLGITRATLYKKMRLYGLEN